MKDLFTIEVTAETIHRIEQLRPDTQPQWGKMNVAEMLAHCCVPFEFVYTAKFEKIGPIKKFLLKALVKPRAVNENPYPKSMGTTPEFIVAKKQDFKRQEERLVAFIKKFQNEGKNAFEGRDYRNFGKLTAQEWNNLFYKHTDHHLTQFGV